MANVKIELNHENMRRLLRSQEAKDVCENYAKAAESRLGDGHLVTTWTGPGRVNASIMAETAEAIRNNAENNTIMKAVLG